MASGPAGPRGSWSPAPYGKACLGCSRAKCKCFYRPDEAACERCQRLGKACERTTPSEKRKPRDAATRNCAKRPRADVQHAPPSQMTPSSASGDRCTPSTETGSALPVHEDATSPDNAYRPDLLIEPSVTVVQLARPVDAQQLAPAALHDVAAHHIPAAEANRRLDVFRNTFLSMFPFVHLPITMTASTLQQQKPFLWLNIMALTPTRMAEQFELGEAIWGIIARRIVRENLAEIDLLLGLVCFGSWSHYFKEQKPFMTNITQMTVTLATELGLHHEVPPDVVLRSKSGRIATKQPAREHPRTLEERRTMLAVYMLTSSCWTAYRKVHPLQWTSYMAQCARTLEAEKETPLDYLLCFQVRSRSITNVLVFSAANDSVESEAPSQALITALLGQLTDLWRSLPAQIRLDNITQMDYYSAELTIREALLGGAQTRFRQKSGGSSSQLQRVQDLDAILTATERHMAIGAGMRNVDWYGMNVEMFSQFTHCLVVLFKLSTLDEPGWDVGEVRKRADLFAIIDHYVEVVESVTVELGLVDGPGPRQGVFQLAPALLNSIKALFMIEMGGRDGAAAPGAVKEQDGPPTGVYSEEDFGVPISDEFLWSLAEEPWISDLFDPGFGEEFGIGSYGS